MRIRRIVKKGRHIMKRKNRFTAWISKYRHAWVFLYILVYLPWFFLLERHVTTHYHVIQTKLDEWIPFNEFFIIPYLMWFAFIAAAFLYFFFKDVPGFYKMAIFPNGQDLRPAVFARDNIFVDMVRVLYRADTCTNVFPSLHVFNSLGVCIAVHESRELKKHPCVCWGAYVLAGLIILSTMFLKQHSILDVIGAGVMACVLYQFVYAAEKKKEPRFAKQKRALLQNK